MHKSERNDLIHNVKKTSFISIFYSRYFGPVQEGGEEMMAVFASEFGIDQLSKAPVIAVDGTFRDQLYFLFGHF